MLPTDAKARKNMPIVTGCLDYFPDALLEVAACSLAGNKQHLAGQPLHWDKTKSIDEPDALVRHLMERGTRDVDGIRHSAKVAWRSLAMLQREIDAEREKEQASTEDTTMTMPEFFRQGWEKGVPHEKLYHMWMERRMSRDEE